ncbi:polyprenyl synthetase family protein [Hydrogenophaga sp.]|uniref:polyprenyl synthetase family protein n=1 Tax=Hydrogenophaga sp. TaxID=1904254 RepID=UPI003F70F97C
MLSHSLDFAAWRQARQDEVEQALSTWVPADAPAGLGEAMRYAVLDGGKRLRPLLVLATSDAVGGLRTAALRAACSVELIHAYSLVHDDMPCMDNDVLRRGKPTVHVRFGEAQALLAGDALQALAFELLVPGDDSVPADMAALLCRLLAQAAGATGMAGGQAVDLASVGILLDQPALEAMHRKKTGALLKASVIMGAATGRASPEALVQLGRYGAALGLAFQVVDDVLDVIADSVTLGKTAGKDAAADKPTFVSLMGLAQAQSYAERVLDEAHAALDQSGLDDTAILHALADWVGRRAY